VPGDTRPSPSAPMLTGMLRERERAPAPLFVAHEPGLTTKKPTPISVDFTEATVALVARYYGGPMRRDPSSARSGQMVLLDFALS